MSTIASPKDDKYRRNFLLKYLKLLRRKLQGPIINFAAIGPTFAILTSIGVNHVAAAIFSIILGLLTKPKK